MLQGQNYLQNQKLINTKKKLFTNDLKIMNLWLLNENNQLIVSDGFTNSLKNKDIEFNFIHSLKDFGVTNEEFINFLSLGKSEIRNDLLLRLFIYRYQANSLYSFSEISNYSNDIRNKILNTSPFRAQMQIMPEDEKKKLIKLFKNIELKKLKETWIKTRKSFEELVNALDESILKKGILRHPIAGRIDINMTLKFVKMHFHHHRKIITKLETKIKSN